MICASNNICAPKNWPPTPPTQGRAIEVTVVNREQSPQPPKTKCK